MVFDVSCSTCIGDKEALKATIVCLTHGRVHTHVSGDSSEQNMGYAHSTQNVIKIRCKEAPLARLVDDNLPIGGLELFNNIPPLLAPDKDSTHGALLSNSRTVANMLAPPHFIAGEIHKLWTMALSSMDHQKARNSPHCLKESFDWSDGLSSQLDVISHRLYVAPISTEVNLHVDYN
eukprot:CAMPEP_0184664976 /NCGR_PEP_ID=MMETSP0308-20130426/55070_1 /TAXON_ID=38269 /ORGANISM="Gloeochaete witrockiana, Strain SAG 46.84" /LENGTH=176 /DNA_ID=CAMNT_0027108687 /DNA_START=607 /DNA_END=1137 /DNA_ORIENTATION=-